MTTITGFSVIIPITYESCPKNMTFSTCPLRKYIADGKCIFYRQEDNLLLTQQNKRSWEEVRANIEQMYEICTKCQMENIQKTRQKGK